VVITIITHFTSTLAEEGGLISQIYALFFTEIITMNAVQVMVSTHERACIFHIFLFCRLSRLLL